MLFITLLPFMEVSGIWWESGNDSRNFSDLSHTASVNSQNDQCLNMPCDGNWHNKESFYPYWIIKNNQYIGRADSLLIRRQGKKPYSSNHLFTMTSSVISNHSAAIALYKWALISIKHLVKVYTIVRLLTCVASEAKPNDYFSDCSHKSRLPAGTTDWGIETTCQRAAVFSATGETGVTLCTYL